MRLYNDSVGATRFLSCTRHIANGRSNFTVLELPNCPVTVASSVLPSLVSTVAEGQRKTQSPKALAWRSPRSTDSAKTVKVPGVSSQKVFRQQTITTKARRFGVRRYHQKRHRLWKTVRRAMIN
uniref:60S ribosomal protein L35 n=1 Tax=Panagrellus redivivus TaxID=6233 RepID=A0A7E4WD31_PANRE